VLGSLLKWFSDFQKTAVKIPVSWDKLDPDTVYRVASSDPDAREDELFSNRRLVNEHLRAAGCKITIRWETVESVSATNNPKINYVWKEGSPARNGKAYRNVRTRPFGTFGHPVEVRRLEALGPEAAHVAVALIVGEDQHDVRRIGRGRGRTVPHA